MRPVELVPDYFADPESLDWSMVVEMVPHRVERSLSPLLAALPARLGRWVIDRCT
jgi:hypothetical protein